MSIVFAFTISIFNNDYSVESSKGKLMKRMDNLYENIYKPENIMQAFDEVCRNMKNKYMRYKNKSIKLGSLIGTMQSYNYLMKRNKV